MLLGVAFSSLAQGQDLKKYNEELNRKEKILNLQDYRVGLIKSIAVKPEFRHRGIGTNLTIKSIIKLQGFGCDLLFAISWDSQRQDSSKKMFEKLGFQNVLEINNYWTEDSMREGYLCPNCGNPCFCRAIFYLKKP